MNSDLSHLIFDLDGTLIDSVPQVQWALNIVFANRDLAALTLDEVQGTVGLGAEPMMRKVAALRGVELSGSQVESWVKEYMTIYLEQPAAKTTIYPGALDCLEWCRGQSIRLGICTNKPTRSTQAVLEALELKSFFDGIVAADDTRHRKPDGRHIEETLKAMGGTVTGSAMVGDSLTDMDAAHAAKIRAVGVQWGYPNASFEAFGADALIAHFNELPSTLSTLFSPADHS